MGVHNYIYLSQLQHLTIKHLPRPDVNNEAKNKERQDCGNQEIDNRNVMGMVDYYRRTGGCVRSINHSGPSMCMV